MTLRTRFNCPGEWATTITSSSVFPAPPTPGGYLGLRVYWTTHSRLAWDRAHRVLGRVLFWGGLVGLAASFVMPWPASFALFFATVALAVSLALLESWRTWRDDPDRNGGGRPGSVLRPTTK